MDEIERVAHVARQLGMKASEVLEIVQVDGGELADGGQLVRTHDGQWTLVRDDGTVRPAEAPAALVDAAEAAMLRGFHGEPEPDELASGGVVKGPGVVLVGEQGPEDPGPIDVRGRQRKVVAPKRRGRA